MGTQNCVSRMMSMPRKLGGATPTTVYGWPERVTDLPRMLGSELNRDFQTRWPRTITGELCSSARKPRPRVMPTSVTSKKLVVVAWPQRRSGSPLPEMEAGRSSKKPATSEKDLAFSRMSVNSGQEKELQHSLWSVV